jgi:hypothetical protein
MLTPKDYSPSLKLMLNQRALSLNDVMSVVGNFDPYRITRRQLHLMRKDDAATRVAA